MADDLRTDERGRHAYDMATERTVVGVELVDSLCGSLCARSHDDRYRLSKLDADEGVECRNCQRSLARRRLAR